MATLYCSAVVLSTGPQGQSLLQQPQLLQALVESLEVILDVPRGTVQVALNSTSPGRRLQGALTALLQVKVPSGLEVTRVQGLLTQLAQNSTASANSTVLQAALQAQLLQRLGQQSSQVSVAIAPPSPTAIISSTTAAPASANPLPAAGTSSTGSASSQIWVVAGVIGCAASLIVCGVLQFILHRRQMSKYHRQDSKILPIDGDFTAVSPSDAVQTPQVPRQFSDMLDPDHLLIFDEFEPVDRNRAYWSQDAAHVMETRRLQRLERPEDVEEEEENQLVRWITPSENSESSHGSRGSNGKVLETLKLGGRSNDDWKQVDILPELSHTPRQRTPRHMPCILEVSPCLKLSGSRQVAGPLLHAEEAPSETTTGAQTGTASNCSRPSNSSSKQGPKALPELIDPLSPDRIEDAGDPSVEEEGKPSKPSKRRKQRSKQRSAKSSEAEAAA